MSVFGTGCRSNRSSGRCDGLMKGNDIMIGLQPKCVGLVVVVLLMLLMVGVWVWPAAAVGECTVRDCKDNPRDDIYHCPVSSTCADTIFQLEKFCETGSWAEHDDCIDDESSQSLLDRTTYVWEFLEVNCQKGWYIKVQIGENFIWSFFGDQENPPTEDAQGNPVIESTYADSGDCKCKNPAATEHMGRYRCLYGS